MALRSVLEKKFPGKGEKEINLIIQEMSEEVKQKILKDKGITGKLGEVKTGKAQKESVELYTDEKTNGTDGKIFGNTIISKNYIGQTKSGDIGKGGNVSNIFEGLSKEDIEN